MSWHAAQTGFVLATLLALAVVGLVAVIEVRAIYGLRRPTRRHEPGT